MLARALNLCPFFPPLPPQRLSPIRHVPSFEMVRLIFFFSPPYPSEFHTPSPALPPPPGQRTPRKPNELNFNAKCWSSSHSLPTTFFYWIFLLMFRPGTTAYQRSLRLKHFRPLQGPSPARERRLQSGGSLFRLEQMLRQNPHTRIPLSYENVQLAPLTPYPGLPALPGDLLFPPSDHPLIPHHSFFFRLRDYPQYLTQMSLETMLRGASIGSRVYLVQRWKSAFPPPSAF